MLFRFPKNIIPCLMGASRAPLSIKAKAKYLRTNLIRKYGKCILTGWLEFQAAHIVPRHVGYALNYPLVNNDENCILLSNSLHTLFDDMKWTFNMSQIKPKDDSMFLVKILVNPTYPVKNSILSLCINKEFAVPSVYIPTMYLHYSVYNDIQNTDPEERGFALSDPGITALYRKHIEGSTYPKLSSVGSGTTELLKILQKKSE